jgi:hypothetical protein
MGRKISNETISWNGYAIKLYYYLFLIPPFLANASDPNIMQ